MRAKRPRPLSKLSGELLGALPQGACLQACGSGFFSLRSNRFLVVSEQRKMTEERKFRFWRPGEKWNESAVFFLSFIFRAAKTENPVPCSLLRNRTETFARQAMTSSFHFILMIINFRPLNSLGELRRWLRDELKERSGMARPESLFASLQTVAAFPCSSLASRLPSLVWKARNNNACSVGFCSQAS